MKVKGQKTSIIGVITVLISWVVVNILVMKKKKNLQKFSLIPLLHVLPSGTRLNLV